ncbi:MAG: anion permease [Candidatus Nitrospinota bacterium M3_3B_026]
MTIALLAAAVLFLAYANGANDNFKGVATLYGSGTASYLKTLRYATFMTFMGSAAAFFLASGLIKTFSGKGLVGADIVAAPEFLLSVGLGAAFTVFTATRLGLPISTTHSLMGGLIGAGLMAVGADMRFEALLEKFMAPLLISPFIAIAATGMVYPVMSYMRRKSGVTSRSCVCVGVPAGTRAYAASGGTVASSGGPLAMAGDEASCREVYGGEIAGIDAQTTLNALHYVSAGAVSFARGLNDTPKILGLLAAAGALRLDGAILLVGAAMAAGGLINARRVAETMSRKITPMNHGQGFSANLVTSSVVIGASLFGAPVSTTHVSVGSLFGLGLVKGELRWKTLYKIFGSWVGTLPVAMAFSAITYLLLSGVS